jgi:CheY-like chemotaxis protein
MPQPDPLLTLKEELEDAVRLENGWLRLAEALAEEKAAPQVIEEALQQYEAARERGRQLLRHWLARMPRRHAIGHPAPSPAGEGLIRRGDYSVLVVDDHEAARYATARALRAAGFRTMEAAAGAEALELAPYASAMVLDVHLPDLDGFEVCRLLRQRAGTSKLPVIHLSAMHVTQEDRAEALAAGADGYMVAPADPDTLAVRLERLLAARAP